MNINRIISDLNKDNRNNYRFFADVEERLFSMGLGQHSMPAISDNTSGTQLVELCTPVERFINAYPQGTAAEAPTIPINSSKCAPMASKRKFRWDIVRSYNTTAGAGNGEGGFMWRLVSRGETVLARALLKRALFISSRVAGAGDWAVMSGHNLRLNNTAINGPGNIFYLTTNPDEYSADQYASSCFSSLLDDVGSTNSNLAGQGSENQIWPINIDDTKRGVSGLPPANLFEKERVDDTTSSTNSSTVRIWSFDDSQPAPGDRWIGMI